MFNDLLSKMNTYYTNFPAETNEQKVIINNLIKEKNNIINNQKLKYNNNINTIKQNFDNSKNQALNEYNQKVRSRNELHQRDLNNMGNINFQENQLKNEMKNKIVSKKMIISKEKMKLKTIILLIYKIWNKIS